jgi:hypothetical protein
VCRSGLTSPLACASFCIAGTDSASIASTKEIHGHERLLAVFATSGCAEVACEVKLGADGRSLEWIERTTQGEVRYDTEPGTSWLQRMGVEMMSILPIEWLL